MGASRDDYSWGSRREPPPRVIMFAGRLAFFSSQLDAKAQLAEAAKERDQLKESIIHLEVTGVCCHCTRT